MRLIHWLTSVVRNRAGRVPRPSWCTYIVTFRCNARCQMCDSWQIREHDEMTPAQVADVFRKIGRLDIVRLTGGEPFVLKHMPEIGRAVFAASRPRVIHITTNGSLPQRAREFVETFPDPKRLRFMVSFDGLPEEHDRNRGKAVTFQKAMETIRVLAELRDTHGIEVSANHTVISNQSLEDNPGLRQELDQYGVEVHSVLAYSDSSMYRLEFQGREAEHVIVPTGYPLHQALDRDASIAFVERELAEVDQYRSPLLRWGKAYYLKGLLARLRQQPNARPKPRCVALRSHIRVLPNGDVPVCQFNTKSVGNLRGQPFDAVWFNGTSAKSRDWVDRCPGCWAECEVMPNAIFSGDILRQVR